MMGMYGVKPESRLCVSSAMGITLAEVGKDSDFGLVVIKKQQKKNNFWRLTNLQLNCYQFGSSTKKLRNDAVTRRA